jgi:hypothetical protein
MPDSSTFILEEMNDVKDIGEYLPKRIPTRDMPSRAFE